MPRKTAYKALIEYTRSKKNINLDSLPRLKTLNQKNKNLAVEIIYGVIRFNKKLDYIIKNLPKSIPGLTGKLKLKPTVALKIAIYQILFLDKVPDYAAVNETVKLLHNPFEKTYTNKFLRFLCENKEKIAYPKDRIQNLSIIHSYPDFLVEKWLNFFGEEKLINILEAGNTPPALSLRINILKTNLPDFLKLLKTNHIDTYNIDHDLNSLSVKNIHPSEIPGFTEGLFYVQDKTATKAGLATDCSPGHMVLDLCAAPGGKTTHMAELMGNRGQITALDVSDAKTAKIKDNIKRLGTNIIEPLKYDGENLSFLKDKTFDRILIDAPCSNSGVLSRRPEARWNISKEQITDLNKIQLKLLSNAAPLIKDKGLIIYSTCSIDNDENSMVAKNFLDMNSAFRLIREETTLPQKNLADGGYFAVFEKI